MIAEFLIKFVSDFQTGIIKFENLTSHKSGQVLGLIFAEKS